MAEKFIYVMQSAQGPIKVGIASNPEARLAGVQSSSPWKVDLIYTRKCKDVEVVERAVHLTLRDRHLSGEWFGASADEAVDAIKRIVGDIPDIVDEGPPNAVGYVLIVPGISAATQRASILAHIGRDIEIFVDDFKTYPAGFRALIRKLHRNEQNNVIVHRLYTMARNRRDLRIFLGDLAKRGAIVIESDTGLKVTHNECANVVLDALDWYGSRGKTFADPEISTKAGSAGGRARAQLFLKMRMPVSEARTIWRDENLTVKQALAKINADKRYRAKWTQALAYDKEVGLGPRDVPAGRRPKKKD